MADDQLTWEAIPEEVETITEEEMRNADSSGKAPIGKYLVVVKESVPRQVNPKSNPGEPLKDSYYNANLKMEIEEILELNGKPVNGDEGDYLIGKFLWDRVRLYAPGEKDTWKNRRIRIAKVAGIISNTSSEMPSKTWSEFIIGKRFIVDNVLNEYKNSAGVIIQSTQIDLFGYYPIDDAVKVSADDIADI